MIKLIILVMAVLTIGIIANFKHEKSNEEYEKYLEDLKRN